MRFGTKMSHQLPSLVIGALIALFGCAPAPMAGDPYTAVPTTPDRTAVISVQFDFDSHRIRPEFFGTLDQLAAAIESPQLAGLAYDVSGHTDRSGRLAYNIALSLLRARAVIDYLASRGVPRERFRAQGFGYLVPLDAGDPYSPVNRRVEVTSVR